MLSVVAVDVWQWTPFVFLVLLAGLQAIPQEPYEAALIDGSTRWQTFRHVTLPLLKPAILIVLLLRTMDLLRVFDQIFILTEGGPGFATETISLYIYRTAFRFSISVMRRRCRLCCWPNECNQRWLYTVAKE